MTKRSLRFLAIFSLLFLLFNDLLSQTISSTSAGGRWEETATWIGGVIPSSVSSVVINGPVIFSTGSGYSCNNLTVNNLGTLYNGVGYAWPDQILTVNGYLINNGTIRNEGNNGLVIKIKGNVTNNGTWTFRRAELFGTSQTISAAEGKAFENHILVDATAKPTLTAGSNLIFTSTVDLSKSTIDMGNYNLSFYGGSATITNGIVNNTADISGLPVTGSTSRPQFYTILFDGNINIKGRIQINSDVTFKGNIIVSDTVESISDYYSNERKFFVIGNITNNGIIRSGGRNPLAINVSGDITNNGQWIQNRTELSGTADQNLSLGTNKNFDSQFTVTDSTGFIKAASSLLFTNSFNLNNTVMDMNNYSLTLKGSAANIYNGIVMNTADLIGTPVSAQYPIIDNITYNGNINLKGLLRINFSVTMQGDITLTDTLQNATGYAHPEKTLKIIGSFTNNGLSRDGGNNGFVLDITGNIIANKAISNKRVQLAGSGNRTVKDKLSAVAYYSTGEKVILSGDNYLPNLYITPTSKCQLANGSTIYIPENIIDENLDNWSEISMTKSFNSSLNYSFFKSRVKVETTTNIDSVKVQSFGHQVPATFAGAVKSWWRFSTYTQTNQTQSFASITFLYNDDILGNNSESALQVFYSADSAKTWKQISISSNVTRNTTDNYLTISDAPVEGDYLLSSSADPTSVSPSIITAVIGSSNIRVGAPTRLKIQYVNNSDVAAQDFLITINTGKKVHIKSVEIPLESGGFMSLPKDSLFYANEDTTLVMYALMMAPREERTFDIIVTGDVPELGKTSPSKVLFLDPVSITAAAVVTWVAWKAGTYVVCKGIDYLGDKAVEGIKMTPEEQNRYDQYVKGGIPTELKERPGAIKSFAVKTVGTQILKKTLNLAPGGVSAVQITNTITQNVSKVAPSLRQRIFNWFYKETGLYGVETTDNGNAYQPQVSTVTQKKGRLVTSWDPNEKVGPNGYGDQMFITSAGKTTYQILFENKKEATAPAYKIVIVDTLLSEFDPETVEFGKTSHEGIQYQWKISREGNILQWEIEGIELPPNIVPPEGEGWVSFTVSPKSGLVSGTDLKNKATIVFDLNNPITTNEYSNRLDFSPPTTTMNQLAQSINAASFTVKWESNDGIDGSGIESATVFMSVDDGPFNMVGTSNSDSLIVSALTETHKYSFYALANDFVGNVETTRPATMSIEVINSVGKYDNTLPKDYSLSQNYPNPFNPSTTIEFAIPSFGLVSLKIYNCLGQEVAALVNEELNAGMYKYVWNINNLSSGVYFYRLKAKNYSNCKKLLILK